MNSTDVLSALLAELLEVEDLAAEAGLGLQTVTDQVEAAHLAAALADAQAAAERLRALLARLPGEDDSRTGASVERMS
jgi:hypothetical protein